MPPEHWAYKQQSKQRFLAWAEQIGEQTTAQVNSIFNCKAHEEQAFRTLKGLQRLGQQYGKVRLEAACRRANTFGLVGLRRIRAILATQLDNDLLSEQPQPPPVVEHVNLRGPQYYR